MFLYIANMLSTTVAHQPTPSADTASPIYHHHVFHEDTQLFCVIVWPLDGELKIQPAIKSSEHINYSMLDYEII